MIEIYGKIESLKKIRSILDERGISEVNSIQDIDKFMSQFELKILSLKQDADLEIEKEVNSLIGRKKTLKEQLDTELKQYKVQFGKDIKLLNERMHKQHLQMISSSVLRIFYFVKIWRTKRIIKALKEKYASKTDLVKYEYSSTLEKIESRLLDYRKNRSRIIDQIIAPQSERLKYLKQTFEEKNPILAGAVREK